MLTKSRQKTVSSVKSISSMASTMGDQYFWKVGITQLHIRDVKPQMPLFKKRIYLLYRQGPPGNHQTTSRHSIQGHQAKQRLIYIQGLDGSGFNCTKQRGFCPAATAYCSLAGSRQSSFDSLHTQSLLIHLSSSAENEDSSHQPLTRWLPAESR